MSIHRPGRRRKGTDRRGRAPFAFTLVEVLVVVALIAMIIAIVLPMVAKARSQVQLAVCLTRQGQLASAIHAYAIDNDRRIPYGPVAGAGTLNNFYPITGSVTPLLSRNDGDAVGLGLLFGNHLSKNPEAAFCSAPDQPFSAAVQIALVGKGQSQGSFIYRHGSSYYFEPVTHKRLQIDKLGLNRLGSPIRALAIDSNIIAPSGMSMFGIASRTHHQLQYANVLYADGHCKTLGNASGMASVDLSTMLYPQQALVKMLAVLEWADTE